MEVSLIWRYIEQLYEKQVSSPGIFAERASDLATCDVSISFVSLEGFAESYIQQWPELVMYFKGDFSGTFRIGSCDTYVGRALEHCIQSMLPEEQAIVVFSVPGSGDSLTPKDSVVGLIHCQVKLNRVFNEKLIFEFNEEEKYEIALENKMKGVELFRNGHIVEAFFRFNIAIKYLISIDVIENNLPSSQVTDLTVILYNNIASCHLKRGNLNHVVSLCNKVLAIQPTNVKALFRRGLARAEFKDFEEAKTDFEKVLQVEPNNVAAITKLGELKHETLKIYANYASVVKKMFEL